jgi:hypothetical protein
VSPAAPASDRRNPIRLHIRRGRDSEATSSSYKTLRASHVCDARPLPSLLPLLGGRELQISIAIAMLGITVLRFEAGQIAAQRYVSRPKTAPTDTLASASEEKGTRSLVASFAATTSEDATTALSPLSESPTANALRSYGTAVTGPGTGSPAAVSPRPTE